MKESGEPLPVWIKNDLKNYCCCSNVATSPVSVELTSSLQAQPKRYRRAA